MLDYKNSLERMVAELNQTDEITVNCSILNPPASPEQLKVVDSLPGFQWPDGLREFYSQVNGMRLEWEIPDSTGSETPTDRGLVNILPVEQVFGDWKDTVWFDEDTRFETVKPFDLFQPEACIAFSMEPGKPPEKWLYYHYFGEDICCTKHIFSQYMEKLIQFRGYYGWNLILAPETRDTPEAQTFIQRIPLVFTLTENRTR